MTQTAPLLFIKTIFIAGIIAGTLDILAAMLNFYRETGKDTLIVLKFIASAVVGSGKAFSGGNEMAALGLLFHYIIAFSFAALFAWLYLKLPSIKKNIILSGILYGSIVWFIMNIIIVPLTKISPQPFVIHKAIIALLIIIGFVGLPIALITHKMLRRTR